MKYDENILLDQCHPAFKHALSGILADLRALNWKPRIASLRRTSAEQAEKLKKGYSKTLRSWHVPGMEQHVQTSPTTFIRVSGNAADIIDSRYGWGGEAAQNTFKFWKDLGKSAKARGCEWGGDWKNFKDVAHVQMRFVEGRDEQISAVG